MSHKLSLISITLIILVGGVWASSLLFPDTTEFPANPQTPGTLGHVFSLFGVDGTAPDTLMLSGRTATGYVDKSSSTCTLPGEVWKGFNTNGTVKCGTRGVLLAIGKFSEIYGTLEVSTNGGASWTPANTTDTLYEGYLVRSDASGTGTIDFLADSSIIRMDTNTLVQLERGNLDGNTVAQAIVNDGRLWGRILTSTGVNIGGGGLIAGVRGTSVSIEENSAQYTLNIIDSQVPTNAATLRSLVPGGTVTGTPILTSGKALGYTSGTQNLYPAAEATNINKSTLYSTSPWVRENTKKDIVYLKTLSSTSPVAAIELSITDPTILEEQEALCEGAGTTWETATNRCVTTLAYADASTLWALKKIGGSDSNISAIPSGTEYYKNYDQITIYNNVLDILGKQLVITVNGQIPSTGKYYFLDMGSQYPSSGYYKYYIISGILYCSTGGYPSVCSNTTINKRTIGGNDVITIQLPSGLTTYYQYNSSFYFLIGARKDIEGNYKETLTNKLLKVEVK